MTPLSRCSPCFGDNCTQPSLVCGELFEAEPDSRCATYETYCSLRPCDGGPVAACSAAAPDPCVQVIPTPALPLQACKEQPCLGDFYERDLNMPVSSGLDSALCLLETPSNWWLSDFFFLPVVLSCHTSLKTGRRDAFCGSLQNLLSRLRKTGSNKRWGGCDMHCTASPCRDEHVQDTAVVWLRSDKVVNFHVVEAPALNSHEHEVRASARTDRAERWLKVMFSMK